MSDSYNLVEVIKELRKDINLAIREGEGHAIRFNLNSIDVELQTVLKKEGNGGVKFEVLGVGAKAGGKLKKANTHKIRLNLSPVDEKAKAAGESGTIKLSDEE